MTIDDESLIERVCSSLELPLSKILLFPRSQGNLFSPPASNEPLQNGPFVGAPQLGQDETFNPAPAEVQNDQSIAFDMQSWTGLTTSEPWDASPSDGPWQLFNDFSAFPAAYPVVGREPTGADQSVAQISGRNANANEQPVSDLNSDDELETDIVPRLAARFGSLRVDTDGRVRYYGSAANHHFLASSTRHEEVVDAQEMRREAFIALENAKLDREVPEALEERLLEHFFKWHNPCHLTVDRATFEAARSHGTHGQSTYCSGALVAAM